MKITAVNRIQSGISSKCRCCIATGLVLLLGSAVTLAATQQPAPGQQAPLADDRNQPATATISELVERPRIQLAVLLDTSSSMDGLFMDRCSLRSASCRQRHRKTHPNPGSSPHLC